MNRQRLQSQRYEHFSFNTLSDKKNENKDVAIDDFQPATKAYEAILHSLYVMTNIIHSLFSRFKILEKTYQCKMLLKHLWATIIFGFLKYKRIFKEISQRKITLLYIQLNICKLKNIIHFHSCFLIFDCQYSSWAHSRSFNIFLPIIEWLLSEDHWSIRYFLRVLQAMG